MCPLVVLEGFHPQMKTWNPKTPLVRSLVSILTNDWSQIGHRKLFSNQTALDCYFASWITRQKQLGRFGPGLGWYTWFERFGDSSHWWECPHCTLSSSTYFIHAPFVMSLDSETLISGGSEFLQRY